MTVSLNPAIVFVVFHLVNDDRAVCLCDRMQLYSMIDVTWPSLDCRCLSSRLSMRLAINKHVYYRKFSNLYVNYVKIMNIKEDKRR